MPRAAIMMAACLALAVALAAVVDAAPERLGDKRAVFPVWGVDGRMAAARMRELVRCTSELDATAIAMFACRNVCRCFSMLASARATKWRPSRSIRTIRPASTLSVRRS